MFGQNKKKSKGFGFKNTAKSLRKKASQAGYKAANTSGYVAGRVGTKIARTPKLRNTVGRVANKLPKSNSSPPKVSIRTQAALTKGLVSGASDSIRASYRKRK